MNEPDKIVCAAGHTVRKSEGKFLSECLTGACLLPYLCPLNARKAHNKPEKPNDRQK